MNWISVKDKLPEENKLILVSYISECPFSYNTIRSAQTSYYTVIDGFSLKPTRGYKEKITHWMPLPDLPNELD